MSYSERKVPDQGGRVAVVTGANSGLGYETARVLAARGATVVFACRSREKAEAAMKALSQLPPERRPQGELRFLQLDLASLSSVREFAEAAMGEFDRIDLLINNAGVMVPPLRRTEDGFELQFGTNHLGHFALTARLLPAIRATPGSRIVHLSSIAHTIGRIDFENLNAEKSYQAWLFYGASKLACLMFSYELQRRFDAAGIAVLSNAAHPGSTLTGLQKHSFMSRASQAFFSQPVQQGALPILFAATSPDARGGAYYGPDGWLGIRGSPTETTSTRRSYDEAKSAKLWERSEELTGIELLR